MLFEVVSPKFLREPLVAYKHTVFHLLAAVDMTLDEYEALPMDAVREPVAEVCKLLLQSLGNNEKLWLETLNLLDMFHEELEVIVAGQPGPNLNVIVRFALEASKFNLNRHFELASIRISTIVRGSQATI